MIDMGASQTLFKSNSDVFQFLFPDRIMSTNQTDFITTPQLISTYAELSNLNRVLINSPGLPIQSNLEIINNEIKVQGSIAEFTLTGSANGIDNTLEYSTELSAPYHWKIYAMISDNDLYSLALRVNLEYKDGSILPYNLSPNSQAMIRVSFFKTYFHSSLFR
jgi:hypothetical protein